MDDGPGRTDPIARLACSLAIALAACGEGGVEDAPGAQLAIGVAALELPGVGDACYTVSVATASDTVWTQTGICADDFGDGTGSVSYVGTCDAQAGTNTVSLVLESLWVDQSGGTPLTDFVNPCPAGDPCTRAAACVANTDTAVSFDLAIIREAAQGFFDVAVSFDNIFCSAKLDCVDDEGAPLSLLHGASGARAQTVVLGLACTGDADGASVDTHLYLDDIVVDCDGTTATVDPSAGPGNIAPGAGIVQTGALLFGAAVYRGAESLGLDKRFWNVAIGLEDLSPFLTPGSGTNCTLATRATASDGALPGQATPSGTRYPVIDYAVTLTNDTGAVTCTTHGLGTGAPGVSVGYTDSAGETFDHQQPQGAATFDPGAGLVSHWAADGDTLDSVGGNHATTVGSLTYSASPRCTAFDFPPTPVTFLRLGNPASLGLTSEVTVSAWVRFLDQGPATASDQFIAILSNWDNSSQGTAGYVLALTPSGGGGFRPGFLVSSDGSATAGAIDPTNLPVGAWTHLVGTFDGVTIEMYVDGVPVASTPHAGALLDPPVNMEINAIERGASVLHSLEGQLDELRVYSSALSAGEVADLYALEAAGTSCP